MTLDEFLLARIAEDEEMAVDQFESMEAAPGWIQWMRAECEAKREAIDAAWGDHVRIEGEWGRGQSREQMSVKDDNPSVVKILAAIYANHPDYREEWRP